MNRGQIRTAIYARLGVPTTDGLQDSTTVNNAINDALHHVESEADWPWLQASETLTTAAGDDTYTPAATWVRTKRLRVADYEPMQPCTPIELDDLHPDSSHRAQPTHFAVVEGVLVVRPVPDGVYSLLHLFTKTETDLTDDAHSPLLPARFHPAIVEYACFVLHRRARQAAEAAGALAAYEGWLRRMHDDRRRTTGPSKVRVRPRAGWL